MMYEFDSREVAEDASVVSGQAESSLDEIHKHNPVFLISLALCTFTFSGWCL